MTDPAPLPLLSVIVITRDEAVRLGTCLASVPFADEIVVVDSGSRDGTVELARSFGGRVIETDNWPGFGPQKQRALEAARGTWVLSLDADEWVDAELGAAIRSAIAMPAAGGASAGYALSRLSAFCGQWMHAGSWSPDPVLRLFRRDRGRFSNDRVHERLTVEGPIGRLPGRLLHDSITDLRQGVDKMNRYTSERAAELAARGARSSLGRAIGHGAWAFMRSYVLRRGFLDGRLGFVLAMLDAHGSYYRHVKLWLSGRVVGPVATAASAMTAASIALPAATAIPRSVPRGLALSTHALRYSGGIERYAITLVRGLHAAGVRPTVIAKAFDRGLPEYGWVEPVRAGVGAVPNKLRDLLFDWRIGRAKRRLGLFPLIGCNQTRWSDIAICGGTHPGFVQAMARRPTLNDRLKIGLERAHLAGAQRIVAHSARMRDELIRHHGIEPAKIVLLYPPVDGAQFSPVDPPTREALRRTLGLPDDRAVFLLASTGHRRKGLDLLVDFFASTELPATLVIAGRAMPGAARNVRHLGYRSDIENVYRAVDFTVMASRYEPFGLVGVESVLCGTPVLLADEVGCAEVIREGGQLPFSLAEPESLGRAVGLAIDRWHANTHRIATPLGALRYDPRVSVHVEALLAIAGSLTAARERLR